MMLHQDGIWHLLSSQKTFNDTFNFHKFATITLEYGNDCCDYIYVIFVSIKLKSVSITGIWELLLRLHLRYIRMDYVDIRFDYWNMGTIVANDYIYTLYSYQLH